MTKRVMVVCTALAAVTAMAAPAPALTIYDVQYSTAATGWKSSYDTQVVNVTGGVVTYVGSPPGKLSPRVVIQDPTYSQWAGVEIKIFSGAPEGGVQVGDRVDLTNVQVDEGSKTRGTTYLIYDETAFGSGFSVVSSGHSVPATVLTPGDIGGGDMSADPSVTEKYEGMLIELQTVTIGSLNIGSHNDNYELLSGGQTCWGSDYMNLDRDEAELYHDRTVSGATFPVVVGILEQYTKESDEYDYYQLLTRGTADLGGTAVPEPLTAVLLVGGCVAAWRRKAHRR